MMSMIRRRALRIDDRLELRSSAELHAIARGLRVRASHGRYSRQLLSRELARIERLIASRQHAPLLPPVQRRQAE
jgi:hypothetical protein